MGLAAALYHAVSTRLRADSVAAYAIWGIFPAFVLMLYGGQRPMKVPELSSGAMYNTRFALAMAIPTVIFVAYLARGHWIRKVLVVALVIGCNAFLLVHTGIMTLTDPREPRSTDR